jgi:hypothetical protein
MSIAFSASASGSHDDTLAGCPQIGEQLAGRCVTDYCAHRHFDHTIVGPPSVAILAHAMLAAASLVLLLIAQIEKRGELRIGLRHHVSPVAAIATVGATSWNEFFPPETDAAAPAVTGDDTDFYFIDELHRTTGVVIITFLRAKKKPRKGLSCSAKVFIEARR